MCELEDIFDLSSLDQPLDTTQDIPSEVSHKSVIFVKFRNLNTNWDTISKMGCSTGTLQYWSELLFQKENSLRLERSAVQKWTDQGHIVLSASTLCWEGNSALGWCTIFVLRALQTIQEWWQSAFTRLRTGVPLFMVSQIRRCCTLRTYVYQKSIFLANISCESPCE